VLVRLAVAVLRAIDPSADLTSASVCPAVGTTSATERPPVVSVPVLSVHTTSTLLKDSTAFTRCTSAPRREEVTAPAV